MKKINFRIIVEKPPQGIAWGLQKGKGSAYETVQKQVSQSGNLEFEFTVEVKPAKDGTPDFFSPYVQGKPGERFVYLDIGTYAGETNSIWGRRLKIPLSGITKEIFDKTGDIIILQCTVPGTGKDGGPNCATVKPFSGWELIGD